MSSAVSSSFPNPPPGFSETSSGVQHIPLRLNGSGSGGGERVLYLRRGGSAEFPSAHNGGGGSGGSTPMLMSSRSYSESSPHVSPHLVGSSGSRRGSPLMDGTGPSALDTVDQNKGSGYGGRVLRAHSYDGRGKGSIMSLHRGGTTSLSPPGSESHVGLGGDLTTHVGAANGRMSSSGVDDHDGARRCSFDERLSARWTDIGGGDVHGNGHSINGSRVTENRRPSSLNLGADHFDQLRTIATSSAATTAAAPGTDFGGGLGLGSEPVGPGMAPAQGGGGGGVRAAPASTKDAIPTQCAEFALLTPKRALVQQSGSASSRAWSTHWGAEEGGVERTVDAGDIDPVAVASGDRGAGERC